MKILIVCLFLIAVIADQQPKYQVFLELWKSKVPKQLAIPLNEYSTDAERCNETKCENFYFISQNPQLAEQPDKNLTVLLLSGLRGSDLLSPSILLNAYDTLKAARIIYFPFANPSGLTKGTDFTFPGNTDVQNDFPIGNNSVCKKTSAYKILQHLYTKYTIDLSVYLHNGKPAFSYSWGKQYHNGDYKTKDFGIYTDISQMVRYKGQENKDMQPMTVGNSFELQLGNPGNFVDWAYGAPQILSKQCNGQPNTPIANMKNNGLVFSLGLGKAKPQQQNSDKFSQYIQRGISILQGLISLTNPKMSFAIRQKNIVVGLSGCKGGSLSHIQLQNNRGQLIYKKESEILVKGDIAYGPTPSTTIALPRDLMLGKDLLYELRYTCDNGWINLGQTAFSKVRKFIEKGVFKLEEEISKPASTANIVVVTEPASPKPEQNQEGPASEEWSILKITTVALLAIFASGWMVAGIRLAMKIQKKQKIKNFNQKFQTIEFVEDNEEFSNNFQEKQHEVPELIAIKDHQGTETDHISLNTS